MTDLPDIKIKALVSFPPNALGGTGIDVAKVDGTFVIDLDYSEFAFSGTLPPNTNTLVWDPLTNVYMLVPPSAVGGISDAPSDSQTYGRKNTVWVPVGGGSGSGDVVGPSGAVNNNFAAFDTTTGKLIKDSGVPTSGPVRYDAAQTLTAPQQTVARQNIYAAPFDALAYSGMQVNGSMEVSQEKGTTSVSLPSGTQGVYVCDGWSLNKAGTSVLGAAVINITTLFPGFSTVLYSNVSTAGPASPLAGDYVMFLTTIEGYRISRLAWGMASAQPLTIGFWTGHHRTGLYSGSIRNGSNTRSYVFTYTQNVADAAEYKVVTIPGCTDGTWAFDNTLGMAIAFAQVCGTNLTAPSANNWLTTTAPGYIAAPGQVNSVAATSDVFRITGVVVLPGLEAPSAARSPLIMRPYDQELVTCMRYWERVNTGAAGYTTAGGSIFSPVSFKAVKRSLPIGLIISWGSTSNATGQTFYDIAVDSAMFSIAAATTGILLMRTVVGTLDARL